MGKINLTINGYGIAVGDYTNDTYKDEQIMFSAIEKISKRTPTSIRLCCSNPNNDYIINLDDIETYNGGDSPESIDTVIDNINSYKRQDFPRLISETMVTIRAITGFVNGMFVECLENTKLYRFNEKSVKDDDGDLVLRPDSIDEKDPGRWESIYQYATV